MLRKTRASTRKVVGAPAVSARDSIPHRLPGSQSDGFEKFAHAPADVFARYVSADLLLSVCAYLTHVPARGTRAGDELFHIAREALALVAPFYQRLRVF